MSSEKSGSGALSRPGLIARALKPLHLRFPTLFVLLATLTVADLLVPDFIPFVDELILAVLTLILGLWRERRESATSAADAEPAPLPGAPPPSR